MGPRCVNVYRAGRPQAAIVWTRLAAIAAIKTILDFKLKTLVITAATHVMRPPMRLGRCELRPHLSDTGKRPRGASCAGS